jgi:hypothetical protein
MKRILILIAISLFLLVSCSEPVSPEIPVSPETPVVITDVKTINVTEDSFELDITTNIDATVFVSISNKTDIPMVFHGTSIIGGIGTEHHAHFGCLKSKHRYTGIIQAFYVNKEKGFTNNNYIYTFEVNTK